MKRSFYGHVFIASLLSVAVFLAASRIVVRHAMDDYLLNYLNETLAHHTAREIDQSGLMLNPQRIEENLAKSIDDVQSDEIHVVVDGMSEAALTDDAWHAALTDKSLSWKALSNQSSAHPFEFVYVTFQSQAWSVLKTQEKNQRVYVAVQRATLVRSFEEILKVRNDMTYRMLPILVLFALFFTAFISYTAVSPILKLQKAFTQIHIRSSHDHINLHSNYREFSRFIDYFNALIDRLRTSYQQAARFSSDASHELRTPLTIIRGHIDRLIHQAPDGSPMQQSLALVGEEVERLVAITNKLLWLSQADAGRMALDKQVVKFNDMVGQMVDDLRMFNAHLDFSFDVKGHIVLTCDHDLLRQLLGNLFSNAIKYNHAEGCVKFFAQAKEGRLYFTVSNTTHLSLEGLDDRVFERFYRYREGANQQVTDKSGSGLGLSLCREILRAHGGAIHLCLSRDGMVEFECAMPLA